MNRPGYLSILQKDNDHKHLKMQDPPCPTYWAFFGWLALLAFFVFMLVFSLMRSCAAAEREPEVEAAYDYMSNHPIDEFAGLPPQDVYAKTER